MKSTFLFLIFILLSSQHSTAQNFGNFPKIEKEKLWNDLELLYQGLDKFHSGMYWYTPKDSVDIAFKMAKNKIKSDMTILEFHKIIAPLVGLSREDHTDIYLPKSVRDKVNKQARFLPLTVVFLGEKMFCVKNGSDVEDNNLVGKEIDSINSESPKTIVEKIGTLFASDGFIKPVKYSDLEGFNFSKYYFYYFGIVDQFEITVKGVEAPIVINSLKKEAINSHFQHRNNATIKVKDLLEFKILDESIAYLGIHSFSNSDIKKESEAKNLKKFLKNSFKSIYENNIKTVIVDVSENGGGTEGNEGLLYSYFGKNYQKYKKVRAKTQKAILDNGVDKPIKLKTFGFWERLFANKKMPDGSYERKESLGYGLKAFKNKPNYKFEGETFVIISPVTYSGGSEFSNMMYTNDLATFVGQETGGGYLGNTSGYSQELVLHNSQIAIDIPALQFVMNVAPKLPFGSGVIPDHEVIPTLAEYLNGENASLEYILKKLIQ